MTRLLINFQAAYDYVDTLAEQPSCAPVANARHLHAALLASLEPGTPHPDYYRHHTCDHDGGYLARIVDDCRSVVTTLPAYSKLAARIIPSARRCVEYQCRLGLRAEQDYPALIRWAEQATPHHRRLRWWETWAACGSSLDTLALLAAAADPTMNNGRAAAVEALYWPWVGALHTLLDCLVDRAEDSAARQPSILDLYTSSREAAERMRLLAAEAARLATAAGTEHSLILAGMASLYISDRQAWTPAARPAAEGVLEALEDLATPAMLVLRARRLVRKDDSGQAHHREPPYPLMDT